MRCDMKELETAAYDPLFYLHHTYVDYVYAFWQELQRLRGHDEVPEVRGLERTLAPFDNRRFNNKQVTLKNNRGRDTFKYSENFCYNYQDLKFDGQTPSQFFNSEKGIRPTVVGRRDNHENFNERDSNESFSERENNERVPHTESFSTNAIRGNAKAQIFIGVVTPKMMPSGFTTFDLCLARTCVEAGKLAFFGSKDANSTAPPKVNSNTYKLSDMDVTKVVLEQGWKADDDLQAVLTNTLVEDLPHPVVIHKFTGPGKVKLPKGKTRRDYGDLLDDYSIVSKAKDI